MKYVNHFKINGIDTKQTACIELNGRPNAATEGKVGLLGIDVSSPTHEVYKCVAVNGSVYTWELLSAGMSIISATITGEGGLSKSFPYTSLLFPTNYLIKRGDLILDSEGYLYQISEIGNESCTATYCGTHIGGSTSGDKDYSLKLTEDKLGLQLVTGSGNIISSIDYPNPDVINETIGTMKVLVNLQSDYINGVRHTASKGNIPTFSWTDQGYACTIEIDEGVPSVGTITDVKLESFNGFNGTPVVTVTDNIIRVDGYSPDTHPCMATVSYLIAPNTMT